MIEGIAWSMVLLAGTPFIVVLFLVLGWFRWWIGAVVLLALVIAFANARARAAMPEADLPVVIIVAVAAGALAGGAWLDRLLRREWGIASGRTGDRIPFLRPLYPRALDAVPALFAALLCAGLAAYIIFIFVPSFNPKRMGVIDIILGFVPFVLAVVYYGTFLLLGSAAALFFGSFYVTRDLRILNLPWFAATGAVSGVIMLTPLGLTPTLALAGAALGVVGWTAGYLELRRRVASYFGPVPGAPAVGAPLPRWFLAGLDAAHAVGAAVRFIGSRIAAAYRAACAAMGATSRARAITSQSLALVGAAAVFTAFGRSSVLGAGYAANDVAWPAVVGAALVAVLAYLVTSAVVARLSERAAQQVALVSLVVAGGGIAILWATPFP